MEPQSRAIHRVTERGGPRTSTEAALAERRQLVVFKVGGEEFAVDIMLTSEVVLMREITPVPETER